MSNILIGFLLLSSIAVPGPPQSRWRVHKGPYFEIKYPPLFKARTSLPSNSFEGEYDSAFFTAPDDSVEFYVFSPLWNGEPTDIEIDPASEDYVSQNTEKKGTIVVRRVTIRAKDNRYLRSFEDTEYTVNNTRKVFGFKYRNQSAYNRHRQEYLMFKRSLRQFSD